MTEATETRAFTNREFLALIRGKLDGGGHGDVALERSWIDEGNPAEPFILNVPLGANLVVPLMPAESFQRADAGPELDWHASYFANALVNLRRGTSMLEKYVEDVARAASREIATAREAGLDLGFEGVKLNPTCAWHLEHSSFEEAIYHVLAEVRVRGLSFNLRPEVQTFCTEEADHVAEELAPILSEQRERQEQLAELERLGADLRIDEISMAILASYGLQADELLGRVCRGQNVDVTVRHGERDVDVGLAAGCGEAHVFVDADFRWNGRELWYHDQAKGFSYKDMVGSTLGDRVSNPVFAALEISEVAGSGVGPERIRFHPPGRLLFDADTGRVWPDEKLAA